MPGEPGQAAEPDAQSSTLTLAVVANAGDWSAIDDPERRVADVARAIVIALGDEASGMATIALSDNAEVRQLNAAWRGKDKPTNVLSFPAAENPGEPDFLGDVILAIETLEVEARELGVPLAHHFAHLVLHGFLHLLGYDHETEVEAEEMERLEVRILATLGIPDPYDSAPAAAG